MSAIGTADPDAPPPSATEEAYQLGLEGWAAPDRFWMSDKDIVDAWLAGNAAYDAGYRIGD